VSDKTDQPEYRQHRFKAPPGATELLLVRHGESAPHREGQDFPLVDGQGDPPLAPEGRNEARRVGTRLALEPIDAIYVTTLRRTVETAEPLARQTGLTPVVEPELREVFLGDWEGGIYRKMVAEGHPAALTMFREERWDAIPGGENSEHFAERVRSAVERLAGAHPDQRVAVFTHGGVIGEIVRQAVSARPFAFIGADNGSISHLVVMGDRWFLRTFNDIAHLSPLFTLEPQPLT
jgi:2,3-bisphosphoglycerate-dependent phosphoglycerate mutase